MAKIIAFFGDEIGGLSVDRVALGAGALLLLSMLAYELFDAGPDALISTADPGVAAFRGELEMANAKNPTSR